MKDQPHGDVFDNPVKVGDFVLYAASLGRSPILKVGLVLELRNQKGGYPERELHKISVRTAERVGARPWVRDGYVWELQKKGSPITLEFTNRMVRVAPKTIPAAVRKMLKA
jgi:hypothetical protein